MEGQADALDRLALTDAVLEQQKDQSPEECLMWFFDAWDAEEWD